MKDYEIPPLGRLPRGKRKPGVNKQDKSNFKYGLEILGNYKDAVRINVSNRNTLWQTAVQTEIAVLIYHDCFEFKSKGFKLLKAYQYVPLVLNFELKQD